MTGLDEKDTDSPPGELTEAFGELRSRGEGHLEVGPPDGLFPYMTLSFRADRAVVHLFTDEETVSLLVGDGTVPWDETVEIPVLDEPAIFTGYFVLRLDTAWSVVRSFARAGGGAEPGEWVVL